jgi:hypothetical protein
VKISDNPTKHPAYSRFYWLLLQRIELREAKSDERENLCVAYKLNLTKRIGNKQGLINLQHCHNYFNDIHCLVHACAKLLFLFLSAIALALCQADPVLNDGHGGSDSSRRNVMEGVRKKFIEKVVAQHEAWEEYDSD